MKRTTSFLILGAALAAIVLGASAPAAAESASVLLEKGIFKEQTAGDLDAAIKIYRQIIDDAEANRKLVAQAHYRLGTCLLKKGDKKQAAACFQKVVSQFHDQKQLAADAGKQLAEIYPGTAERLPLEVISWIIDKHMEAYKQAQAKGLRVNTHIYGVDDRGNLYPGGLLTVKNETGRVIAEEISIGNFSYSIELSDERGVPQKFRMVDRKTRTGGRYRLFWTPDRPIQPGQVRLLGWLRKGTRKLPAGEGGFPLRMHNHFGSPVLENFFLVVPHNVAIAKESRDHTARERRGIFDIYLWQRQVPANTTNEVNIVLKRMSRLGYLPLNRVIERTVYDDGVGREFMIDLDTGKLFTPDVTRAQMAKQDFRDWLAEQGFDAGAETAARRSGLYGGDMVVIPMATERWEKVSLAGIRDDIARGKPGTPAVMSALGELPRTYAFKTREGSIGVLQILEVVNKRPRHLKIRYKLLKHGLAGDPTFGPVIERVLNSPDVKTIDNCIDLDTGKTFSFPLQDRSFPQWIETNQIDFAVGDAGRKDRRVTEIVFVGIGAALIPTRMNKVKTTNTGPRSSTMYRQKFGGERPQTFMFQTRDSGIGLLQILSLNPQDGALSIRYKLLKHGVAGRPKVTDADRRAAEDLAAEGWRLWRQRKLPDAESKFKQAVAKDPNNANAWNGLGWAQFNQGSSANAKLSFRKCVSLEPKHAAALNGLGWIAKSQGKTAEAIGHWEKAVAAAPTATAALSGLAQAYEELKQYDKAVKYYRMWLKAEPKNKDAKSGLKKAQDAADAVKAAVSTTEAWLKVVDDGKYGESWDAAADFFRKAVPKGKWEQQLQTARTPLGKVRSRRVLSAVFATSLPGAPDGRYVVVQFETVFQNKKQAVETITPMRCKDGKWRVSGYYIK